MYQNGINYTNTLGSGYRFEPRQRYGFDAANNTIQSDITVKVNGLVVGSSNWEFDEGDRWQITTASTADENNPLTVTLNTGIVNGETTIANENYTTISNNNYPFVDVYVNNVLIENRPDETVYTITDSTIEFANISLLPKSVLTSLPNPSTGTSRFVLNSQANVYVVEKATIDFKDIFKDDITDSVLQITVETRDNIAIKLGTRRNFEITPDAKDDDIILIDIDDAERFLKKPIGVRENNLWPTTTNVNAYGVTLDTYATVPNAGYVNPSNINFMAYDISSLPDLFDDSVIIKPAGGSLIHMAEDESNNWNVYKLRTIGSKVSFVQSEPGTNEASLFTDVSLFAFLDTNLIGGDNTSTFMDYYLTLKNADVSDNVVVWTNETVIQQRQALIKDPQPPQMIEARIKSIGPHPDSVVAIENILPVSSKVYRGATASASSPSNVVTISNITNSDIRDGDAVQLVAGESTDYTFNANVTFNSVGNVTIDSANTTLVTAPSFVTLLCDGDSTANGNIYFVKSVDTGNSTFVIESDYFADAGTVSGLGNVRYVTSTFVDYGSVSNHFVVSNATTNSFTIELPGVTEKTATFNGSINGTTLTVNSLTDGTIEGGMRLSSIVTDPLDPNFGNDLLVEDTFITSGRDLTWFVSNSQTTGNVVITATRPNVIDVRHMNLTKLVTGSNHSLSPGDVVKVYANAWTGAYIISAVPESNTVIIPSAYTTDANNSVTGTILKRGLQIRTTDPHGITKDSVDLNKRVAVHFASPKSYNKIYRVTSVGSDTINVLDQFPTSNATNVYFDVASGFVNNLANTISIARRPLLQSTSVLYASNTQPVAPGNYYVDETLSNTTITFKNTILNEDSNISTGFVIIREPITSNFKFPVVTTVDHGKVTLNKSVINISSYNNPKGMVESINRAIKLRRGAVTTDRSGKLNVSFNMLEDFKTPVVVPSTDTLIKPSKIHNYGPYVRDAETLEKLLGQNNTIKVAGDMKISDPVEYEKDNNFNTGPIYVGPVKGMSYVDTNGVAYNWDIRTRQYIPLFESIVDNSPATGLELQLERDTSISDGSEESIDLSVDDGQFYGAEEAIKPKLPKGHTDGGKVLVKIPGTADSNPSSATKGVKWAEYDMSENVTYSSVTYPRWRLKTSEIWQFEVYEAVQNSASEVYYILVDVVT